MVELCSNRIAIKLERGETMTPGGIALPDHAIEKRTLRGRIVAKGPGEWSDSLGRPAPMTVRVGDLVAIDEYGAREIEVGSEKLTITHEGNVLAILERAK